MDKIKVAVLFGGCSEEHDVSIKSAVELAANINMEKYEPVYVGITKSGAWKICEKPGTDWEKSAKYSAIISPDKTIHGLFIEKDTGYEVQNVDIVFPMLHGRFGEDGSIQGLLELSGISYVGCDIPGSVVCMDKALAYIVVKNAGIDTPEYQIIQENESVEAKGITYPVFVKPARSGSSFGVSKVCRAEELSTAISEARRFDSKVLIEQAVDGLEVGCALLGKGSELFVGEVDEIRLKHGFFKIHQEAHPEKGSENAVVKAPADLSEMVRKRIQVTAKKIYRALGCSGLARIDLFLREDGRIVLNEVNTMPGFTSYSRYPRMMAAAGVPISELFDYLIELSLGR